jgi:hypothetical protein
VPSDEILERWVSVSVVAPSTWLQYVSTQDEARDITFANSLSCIAGSVELNTKLSISIAVGALRYSSLVKYDVEPCWVVGLIALAS